MPVSFEHPPFDDHALLDAGGGEKLERFGSVVLRRPDPQALWRKRLGAEWERADLCFVRESDRGGRWEPGGERGVSLLEDGGAWRVSYGPARLVLRPTPFKHVGLFPEQATNWELLRGARPRFGDEPPRLLNLFGYSGAASVLAAAAGWRVTHVDASRTALAWLRDNLAASDLARAPVRMLLEDALTFARRERRRGSAYEAILLDPPHHGRGPKGERWQLEDDLAELVETAGALLAERSLLVLSTYAVGFSPLALENLLADLPAGRIAAGELALPEAGGARLLPAGFCARWWRGIELGR
ncbi:MAG: RsmD family RNA methyltransferase [Planctomycetota bacterium]|jgi:23S rRNA (cytosine1962-C5)-methyltransferase|nr:RsmD family RNA methyltransferase [Planctomycetota bacterium]MDP6763296.1 RsmD family RNA methyltransferase [Planctomycetota bacterium]MDP6987974.1 RsmD family RNA methyltransferase [Planctomycetota bacterium]